MHRLYLGLIALVATAAFAVPPALQPPVSVDTSTLAAKTDLPANCATPPAPDASAATTGVGAYCLHRIDAAAQTAVMPSTAVTLSDGTFSGTWPGTFPAAPTTAFAQAKTTSAPYQCQVGTATTTGYSGKCWATAQQITLPSVATSLLSLVLNISPAAPAGITVQVVGRQ